MAVCVRGARRARIEFGARVAVLGAGTIGLLSILTARDAGAGEVFVTARHPHQRALAESLGATRVFPTIDAMVDGVGPQSMDAVVETVGGKSDSLTEAVSVAARGGTIAM